MGYGRKNKKIARDPNSRLRLWARRLKLDLPCLSLTARGDAESNSLSGNGIAQIPFFVKRRPHPFLGPEDAAKKRHPRAAGGLPRPHGVDSRDQPGHDAAMFRASRTILGHATRL